MRADAKNITETDMSVKGSRPVLSEQDKADICALRCKGYRIREIMAKYGVSRQTISKILNPPMTKGCTLRLRYCYGRCICTLIDVDFLNQTVKIFNRTDDILSRAFGVLENPTWDDFQYFLESRCFERDRADIKDILKTMGLDSYDPLQMVEKTQGRTYDDGMHLEFVYRTREVGE